MEPEVLYVRRTSEAGDKRGSLVASTALYEETVHTHTHTHTVYYQVYRWLERAPTL